MRDPRHILITGASSGIGAALARRYARPGTTLDLAGRDAARLEAVAAACRAAGAQAFTQVLDVVDRAAADSWILRAEARAAVDLVIANAGISGGTGGVQSADGLAESRAQMDAILDANVQGLVNTVTPALRTMAVRGRGQVALMSSVASFRGFPGAPAYCASKAWVRVWAEGLRPEYAGRGVAVSVICPGYVRSPMTDRNDFPMPFLVEVERAADVIVDGLSRNRARIVFPRRLYWLLRLYAALPEPLLDIVMRRLPRKGAGAR
jgi:short-subunit dehydrogenase